MDSSSAVFMDSSSATAGAVAGAAAAAGATGAAAVAAGAAGAAGAASLLTGFLCSVGVTGLCLRLHRKYRLHRANTATI